MIGVRSPLLLASACDNHAAVQEEISLNVYKSRRVEGSVLP